MLCKMLSQCKLHYNAELRPAINTPDKAAHCTHRFQLPVGITKCFLRARMDIASLPPYRYKHIVINI